MIKKAFWILGIAPTLFAFADDAPELMPETVEPKTVQVGAHRIYFGPEFLCYQLKTSVQNVHVRGNRFFEGFRIGYAYEKPQALYAGIDLLKSVSTVDFKASKHHKSLSWHRADREFDNLETRFGYTFSPDNWSVSPFAGAGIYGLFALDHHNDQGFVQVLPYATLGMKSKYTSERGCAVGINAKVFHTFAAYKRFKSSKGKKTEHPSVFGGELGIPFTWKLGNRWDVEVEPYFLSLNFSQVQNIYGTRAAFGYRF